MKSLSLVSKLFLFAAVTSFIFIKLVTAMQTPILFQSVESKTENNFPVINEVQWFEYPDHDVWMMNQNHEGFIGKDKKWDRLAIIIDKTVSPKTARFLQIEPGPLVWSEDLIKKQVSFNVSCFMCHSNGLRTIRPEWSGLVKPTLIDQVKVNLINMKINSYGRVVEHSSHAQADENLKIPFRYRAEFQNEVLKVKVCFECHNGEKLSLLTRQNALPISFMVDQGLMPPKGHVLLAKERKQIQNFIDGF